MSDKQTVTTEIAFERTPLGQIIYDLGFVKRSDKWLARKHRIPVARIRALRIQIRKALKADRSRHVTVA